MKHVTGLKPNPNDHLAHAHQARFNRKRFAVELIAIVVASGLFGLASSDFFLSFLSIDPSASPPSQASWKDTVFVTLSLFGVFIWPAVFAIVYLVWARRRTSKFEAQQWKFEEELREKRKRETQARIENAQNSGALDRFKSSE